jgi:hypothetical protein
MNKWFVNEALEELGEVLVRNMRQDVPVDTGQLRDSISYEVKNGVLYIYMEDYGEWVDSGTRPHKVSPQKLEAWCNRKGLNPFAVAKNIEKYGTQAQPFMDELRTFEAKYFKLFEDSLYPQMEEVIWDTISEIKRT